MTCRLEGVKVISDNFAYPVMKGCENGGLWLHRDEIYTPTLETLPHIRTWLTSTSLFVTSSCQYLS